MNKKLKLLLSKDRADNEVAYILIRKDKEFEKALYHVVRYIHHRYYYCLPRYFKGLHNKNITSQWQSGSFAHDTYYQELKFAWETFDRNVTKGVYYEKAKEGLKIIMKP